MRQEKGCRYLLGLIGLGILYYSKVQKYVDS